MPLLSVAPSCRMKCRVETPTPVAPKPLLISPASPCGSPPILHPHSTVVSQVFEPAVSSTFPLRHRSVIASPGYFTHPSTGYCFPVSTWPGPSPESGTRTTFLGVAIDSRQHGPQLRIHKRWCGGIGKLRLGPLSGLLELPRAHLNFRALRGRCCGSHHASVLPLWGHCQHCLPDGIHRAA